MLHRQLEGLAFECVGAATQGCDRVGHATLSPEQAVGQGDDPWVGRCGRRSRAQGRGKPSFITRGSSGASDDEGGRRGSADPGVAVDEERRFGRPALTKGEQPFDHVPGGRNQPCSRFRDVMEAEIQTPPLA